MERIFVDEEGREITEMPAELRAVMPAEAYAVLAPDEVWNEQERRFVPREMPEGEGINAVVGKIHVFTDGKWHVAFDTKRSDITSLTLNQSLKIRPRGPRSHQEFMDSLKTQRAGRALQEEYGRTVMIDVEYPPKDV